MGKNKLVDDKKGLPFSTNDAADVMSKHNKKTEKNSSEKKKFQFPPIHYEKPPHY